tara:strand:- start:6748 stop:7536 length:789 start_codon:yes stop_codon:yes gene_type:complete
MKKYLVIGNPIKHSLSPELHNYWIKKNKIKAIYDKLQVKEQELKEIIALLKNDKLAGANVTVPYKNAVVKYMDELTNEAKSSQSINTIYKIENKLVGHNTDIAGFELALRHIKYNINNKKVLILGSGGVVPSIILALKKMKASKIILSNRTKKNADRLNNFFKELKIIEWGEIPEFDVIINATSIGLNKDDEINLNYKDLGSNKLFYDLIYNPKETNFLKKAKAFGNTTENGKMMFIYQAHQSFTIWHKVMPEIDDEVLNLI